MASLPETSTYDVGIYQLETTDQALGGATGVINTPAKSLANRTNWLKAATTSIYTALGTLAGVNSPAFTGTPTCPDAPAGDHTHLLVSTNYMDQRNRGFGLIDCSAGGSTVSLTQSQINARIIYLSGALTGNVSLLIPSGSPGSWIFVCQTSNAFTVSVSVAGSAVPPMVIDQGYTMEGYSDGTSFYAAFNDFKDPYLRAATATPPGAGDNSARVATTSWLWGLFAATANTFKLPGGYVLQWGTATVGSGTDTAIVALPLALTTPIWAGITDGGEAAYRWSASLGTTQITCWCPQNQYAIGASSITTRSAAGAAWLAFGKL